MALHFTVRDAEPLPPKLEQQGSIIADRTLRHLEEQGVRPEDPIGVPSLLLTTTAEALRYAALHPTTESALDGLTVHAALAVLARRGAPPGASATSVELFERHRRTSVLLVKSIGAEIAQGYRLCVRSGEAAAAGRPPDNALDEMAALARI